LCFAEVFMMFKRFSVAFVGSFRYKIIAPENKDNLTSFFLIWIHYILFSYLISLVKNSNTLLNKSFSQCPASMMLDLGLSKIAFIMLSYIPSITRFFTIFIMKGYWILTRDFFCIPRWSCGFCPWFCLHTVLHVLICICWAILASLEWNQLDHGVRSLWCVIEFGLQVLYLEFLHLWSLKSLTYTSLFCCVFWFWNDCNSDLAE
jgi:hypothetical protein